MSTRLDAYIHFRDNARQAMEFYQSVFGGKLTFNTFKEFHASQDPSEDHKIMHSQLVTENGIHFMAADTPMHMEYEAGANMSMSLSGEDEKELRGYYDKLSAGGTVVVPLEKSPWGDTFGMLKDKFGIEWMVDVVAPQP